jgi:hypothetical protein
MCLTQRPDLCSQVVGEDGACWDWSRCHCLS